MKNKNLPQIPTNVAIIVIGVLVITASIYCINRSAQRRKAAVIGAIIALVEHLDSKIEVDKQPAIDTNYYKVDYEALRSVRDNN